MISRRAFIGAGAAALVAMPRASRAQESAKPWRIGFLEAGAPAANQHFLDAFKRGLTERGYVEGQNVVIVDRWGDGHVDRFPPLLNELVQEKVDIVVVSSTARRGRRESDQSRRFRRVRGGSGPGWYRHRQRPRAPGANLTGFSQAEEEGLVGKRLELFRKRCLPGSSRPDLESDGPWVGCDWKEAPESGDEIRG